MGRYFDAFADRTLFAKIVAVILPVNIESDTPGGVEAIKKLLKETLSRVSGVDTSLFER